MRDNNKIDGKLHVIILDSYTSHTTLGVIKFAVTNNMVISQLPSQSSHPTQPFDVCAFSTFERMSTGILKGGSERTELGCL